MDNFKDLLQEIQTNPQHIQNFKLDTISCDEWSAIFKTNENVRSYLPPDIKCKKEVNAVLLSHNHVNQFNDFDETLQCSKNFIILCMQKKVKFTKEKLLEIEGKYPHDKDILKSAFYNHYLNSIFGEVITKRDVIDFALEENDKFIPSEEGFDLSQLPARLINDEEFMKEVCQILPECYKYVIQFKINYSADFLKKAQNYITTH